MNYWFEIIKISFEWKIIFILKLISKSDKTWISESWIFKILIYLLTIYYKFNLSRWLSPDHSNVMTVMWSASSKVRKTKHQKPLQKTSKSLHFSQHFLIRSPIAPWLWSLNGPALLSLWLLIDDAFAQDVILCCLQLEPALHVKNC